MTCPACSRPIPDSLIDCPVCTPTDPARPDKHIDRTTGIWPIAEWGSACARGFVSDARFARGNEQVIKRTNRHTTRKWRKLEKPR